MKNTQKRFVRNILINKNFQLKFLGLLALVFFVNALLTVVIIQLKFAHIKGQVTSLGGAALRPILRFVEAQQNEILILTLSVTGLNILIFFVFGLWLSHKIAGPMKRFSDYLIEVKASNHKKNSYPLKFRDGDFFCELADNYNEAHYDETNENKT